MLHVSKRHASLKTTVEKSSNPQGSTRRIIPKLSQGLHLKLPSRVDLLAPWEWIRRNQKHFGDCMSKWFWTYMIIYELIYVNMNQIELTRIDYPILCEYVCLNWERHQTKGSLMIIASAFVAAGMFFVSWVLMAWAAMAGHGWTWMNHAEHCWTIVNLQMSKKLGWIMTPMSTHVYTAVHLSILSLKFAAWGITDCAFATAAFFYKTTINNPCLKTET